MNDSTIHALLAEQQKSLRELTIKVDFVIQSVLVLQELWSRQAVDPSEFQHLSYQKMRKLVQDLRRSARLHDEMRSALRANRRGRRPPPSSQN